MDASSRYLVERMLNDVQFLLDQGHIQRSQATTIRSTLTPLLDQNSSRIADSSPRPAAFPLGSAPSASSSSVSLASAAKSKVPPPPPASSSSSAFSPRHTSSAAVSAEGASPYPPSYGGIVSDHKQTADPNPSPEEEWAKALWSFDASGGDDELRFEVGDEIRVLERLDENWWKGRVGKAGGSVREGVFPASYVELIPTPSHSSANTSTEKARLGAGASSAGESKWPAPKARFAAPSPAPPPPGQAQAQAYGYPQPGSSSYQSADPNNHPWQSPSQGYSQGSGSGYNQPHQGPAGLQPVVAPPPSEEDKTKRQGQVKKFLKTPVGTAVASGVGFGVGASLVSNIL